MAVRAVVGFLIAAAAIAAESTTTNEIVALVRSAIQAQEPDQKLAKALHKLKPTERVDSRTVEELESEGAGPLATAELERFLESSEKLPEPAEAPSFPHPSAPDAGEQRRTLEAARRIALGYVDSLPDFICSESVERYQDTKGPWDLKDTIELKLTYFGREENYKLVSINGKPSVGDYTQIGGAISRGEFGAILRQVFDPISAADFTWDHWTTLRHHPAHVYSFNIPRERSNYHIAFGQYNRFQDSVIVAQHGFAYVDRDTGKVLRILAIAYSFPPGFPVRSSSTQVDYDNVDISGRSFHLPIKAEVRMATHDLRTRNVVRFYGYRKFGSESSISFDK
jgi:hypothetical protein